MIRETINQLLEGEPRITSALGTNNPGSRLKTVKPLQQPRCALTFGRVNINTASLGVLAALPGMSEDLLSRLHQSRMLLDPDQAHNHAWPSADPTLRQTWETRNPLLLARWRNLSDFLLDEAIWTGRPLYDRLDSAYPFARLLTTHSMSMQLSTLSRSKVIPDPSGRQQRPSQSRAERLLAGDRGVLETVGFRYSGRGAFSLGDPDMRYAAPDPLAPSLTEPANQRQLIPPTVTSRVAVRIK